jgi:adenylate kinase family enzyme
MIIGICGYIGSGKSTLAKYLTETYNFEELAFADSLKQACGYLFDLSHDQLYVDKETVDERWGVSPRAILQKVGTNIMRDTLPLIIPELKLETSIWIKLLTYKVNKILEIDSKSHIVISDVRFHDEVKAIKDLGGIILKVNRTSVEPIQTQHESENANELNYDNLIENNGTLDDFYKNINKILFFEEL